MHSPRERRIEVLRQVRREDDDAVVLLHLLQQVGDFDVRVAIVRVLDLRALAEQRIGFVEEQHRARASRGGEDALEVLLGLADVLRHDRCEIDAIQLQTEPRSR